jgi:hypothetical protein
MIRIVERPAGPRRTRGPITAGLLYLLATMASGCGHHGAAADQPAGMASPGPAQAATTGCAGAGTPSDECCQAMMNEGDALLARGNRQGAYDKYEETRSLCLKFHPVRKRIFLVKQPTPPRDRSADPAVDARIRVNFDLHLGADVNGIAHATYLDGDFVPPGRPVTGLHPGGHELAVEVYVTPKSTEALQPARLDVHQALVLPASMVGRKSLQGGATVHVTDRGGAGMLADRLAFTVDPMDFGSIATLTVKAGSQRLLTDITKDPHRPRLPPSLNRDRMQLWALFDVCVDKTGAVTNVKLLKSADPQVDADWTALVRDWRYQPYEEDGRAMAFCHPLRLMVGADFGPKVN